MVTFPFSRRPALVQVPVNTSITPVQQKAGSGTKRSREDDPEDPTATRSSAKRVRLDGTPPTATTGLQIPSLQLTACTPEALIFTKDKSKDLELVTKSLDVVKDAPRSPKKSRADKEKSRASKLEAEENFRTKYRAAFPHWKFYFDGVPLGAVNVATRRIEQLGGVVEGFLSKEVTHLITPLKVDKDKENDTQHKTLSISHPLGTLRSPFDLKTGGYNPVDRAKEWGCKIWDISKLDSVLERTTAAARSSAKSEAPPSSLQGLLTLEKAYSAISSKPTLSAKPAPVPIFKPKPQAPFNLNSTIPLRKPPPPFHTTTTATAGMARDRKLNPASRALVGLLKTEKATNTTMERDPKCQRHDYTYFCKLAAFVIVETVHNDIQPVGHLEYKPKSVSTSFNHAPRLISFDSRGAFNLAHRGPAGKDLPEYPLLHLDPRMRSPFAPYHPRVSQKEAYADQKDRDDKDAKENTIRLFRAHKRAVQENHVRKSVSMSDLRTAKALATAAHHHAQLHGADDGANGDRASGFIHSTAGTGAYSMASGSVAPLSTAFTGGSGYPPTTSHLTTSFSFSQSGGTHSWAKFHGAGGVVPSFGGVKNATQVVMNRGAFAEGESRSRKTSLSRTVSLAAVPVKAEQKNLAAAGPKLGDGKLRRTQSMMAIKPAKEAEAEKKKPEGYCECCKEQYESLAEHIKGKKHRKFAVDPARYKELDRTIRKLGRITKEARQIAEAMRAPVRAAARERYFQRMHDLIAITQPSASGNPQPSPSTNKPSIPRNVTSESESTIGGVALGIAGVSYDDDPDKTLSSSLAGDALEAAAFMQFFESHSGSSEPPFTEIGTVTTDTSACITPVDDLGLMAALAGETSRHAGPGENAGKEKEMIFISSDAATMDSSFEIALASSATTAPLADLLGQFNTAAGDASTGRTGVRMPHCATPMPSRIFDAATGIGSTDPVESESEALADVLRRKKNEALAHLAQTSEREQDSDGLEILLV